MITTVHIFGMGFTQSAARLTGMERVWCRLRDLSSASTLVMTPLPWDTDPEPVAALIDRNATAEARIFGYFYSWGGGWLFPRLAKELGNRGRHLEHVVLCDAVARTSYLPSWIPINPLSMTKLLKLEVPHNVNRVTWFRQHTNRPAGHDLAAAKHSVTVIEPCMELQLRHEEMDDAPEFQAACLEIAGLGVRA